MGSSRDILPMTSSGVLTTSPRAGTMGRIAEAEFPDRGDISRRTDQAEDREYLRRVAAVFERMHSGLLNAGIAALDRVGLEPADRWRTPLRTRANRTWQRYLGLLP